MNNIFFGLHKASIVFREISRRIQRYVPSYLLLESEEITQYRKRDFGRIRTTTQREDVIGWITYCLRHQSAMCP